MSVKNLLDNTVKNWANLRINDLQLDGEMVGDIDFGGNLESTNGDILLTNGSVRTTNGNVQGLNIIADNDVVAANEVRLDNSISVINFAVANSSIPRVLGNTNVTYANFDSVAGTRSTGSITCRFSEFGGIKIVDILINPRVLSANVGNLECDWEAPVGFPTRFVGLDYEISCACQLIVAGQEEFGTLTLFDQARPIIRLNRKRDTAGGNSLGLIGASANAGLTERYTISYL